MKNNDNEQRVALSVVVFLGISLVIVRSADCLLSLFAYVRLCIHSHGDPPLSSVERTLS